jgi:hypothetical protein
MDFIRQRIGGRILNPTELASIFQRQRQGLMTTVEDQRNLRRTFLENVAANHPAGLPNLEYDLTDPHEQTWFLSPELMGTYNIAKYLAKFEAKAPVATAGLRDNFDVVDFNNPNYMYNPVFLGMLIQAEARFMHELHAEKANTLGAMDLDAKAAEIEAKMPAQTVQVVREIFSGRSVREILELLKTTPLKVMAKEVRPQTDEMLEFEARVMAANGVTVITTEHFTDSSNIYLNSFLCYLLGSDGGTFYTPSHSSVYVLGRKALAGNGAQLPPVLYQRFIYHLKNIYGEAMAGQHAIRIAAADDQRILKTLTYDRTGRVFAQALAPDPETVVMINEAESHGFRIILNTLSGSGDKSLTTQLQAMGVHTNVFTPLWHEENPFFEVGYTVVQKDGQYLIDHLGVDTSSSKVVAQIPYAEVLRGQPVGTLIYECDPDNDRFLVKQVLGEESIALCEAYGIDYYRIGDGHILAAPSPNKTFLLLDIADYERMKASGEWDQAQLLYFPTYVSSSAWVEFSQWLESNEGNVATFLCRVGFKNFNQILAQIEDWWFKHPEQDTITITPQLGKTVTIDRSRMIRVLSKEEESGGRTAGFRKAVMNILGEYSLSLPEKAVGDALMAHLADSARRFNTGEEMAIPRVVEAAFSKYGLKSRIDVRIDVVHGDQGVIAQVSKAEADALVARAEADNKNFNNFFFSVGQAVRDGRMTLEQARQLLTKVVPEWRETWECLEQIYYIEEELDRGTRPEGVMMTFREIEGGTPLVTAFKFRPSGTDPLKSKVYCDAEMLPPTQKRVIETVFNRVKGYDLYEFLCQNSVANVIDRPANLADLGLQRLT